MATKRHQQRGDGREPPRALLQKGHMVAPSPRGSRHVPASEGVGSWSEGEVGGSCVGTHELRLLGPGHGRVKGRGASLLKEGTGGGWQPRKEGEGGIGSIWLLFRILSRVSGSPLKDRSTRNL